MVQEANAEYLAAVRIAMIHDAASLIADLQVKQNGKTVYYSNNLYRVTNIKHLLTMSQDYANSSATSEYFYLDTGDTTIKMEMKPITTKDLLFVVLLFWPVKSKIQ